METPPLLPPDHQPKPSPALALILGFVPAALGLLLMASNPGKKELVPLLIGLAVGSLVCCLASSLLLFRRHTGGAIAGAIVFLLLNGFIAFFSGCLALFSNTNFH
ncbi:MAG: hypothetical protein HY301_05565 [Verrucomicrobia bacterium]|nr:hypothetical protein [Verrucomicrobiota bacterium]